MSETKFLFALIKSDISPSNEIAKDLVEKLIEIGGERFNENKITSRLPLCYLVLTGGTEKKIINIIEERKKNLNNEPVILIAHPENNSLPASLETLAYLINKNINGKIIYIDENLSIEHFHEIEKLVKYISIYNQLNEIKVGLIGEPSDWLIASNPDHEEIKKHWGINIAKIDIDELINQIENVDEKEIEEENFLLTKKAIEIKEPSKKEIKNVIKVYNALKKVIQKYSLNSVSLRCFDLVTELKTTGCFALSKLNDEGIIAGCEGDIVSTIGMIWLNMMTDQLVWMANPAKIYENENSVLLAHCTVPISMTQNYKLRSHFESNLGVGIQGEMSKGKVTLLRLGGTKLEKIWTTTGEIIESSSEENLCRTQVKVKLHGSKVSELLNSPLGNHILMVRGNFVKDLINWWELFISKIN